MSGGGAARRNALPGPAPGRARVREPVTRSSQISRLGHHDIQVAGMIMIMMILRQHDRDSEGQPGRLATALSFPPTST